MRRRRVLVLGGSGWIGSAAVPALEASFDVAAPGRAALDVADAAAVEDALRAHRADAVLNLAARNPPADRAEMRRVNASGAGAVASACASAGVRLVHMSTDLVLDGRSAPYRDDAPARPLNDYGRTKAEGEDAVLAASPGALVVRTSLVVDERAPERFTRRCLERIARGETVTLFTDEIRCAITRGVLARALADLLVSDASGRLNVAGTEPISRRDLGLRLLRRFGARDLSLVRDARAADHPEPRPLDLTLDVSRAQMLLSTALPPISSVL